MASRLSLFSFEQPSTNACPRGTALFTHASADNALNQNKSQIVKHS